MQRLVNRGMDAKTALYETLSKHFSSGMVDELIASGKSQKVKPNSLLGLGCACAQGPEGLDGFWSTIGSPFRKAGGAIKSGAESTFNFVKDGVQTIGKYACKAIHHPLAEVGAAAAAGAKGAPPQTGQAGVNVARGIACPRGQVPVLLPPPPVTPQWVMPAVIGGGVLLAVIALRK